MIINYQVKIALRGNFFIEPDIYEDLPSTKYSLPNHNIM